MVIQRKVKKTKHGRWRVLGPVIMEDRSWPGRKRMEYACLGFQGDPVGYDGAPLTVYGGAPVIIIAGDPEGLFVGGFRYGLDQYVGVDQYNRAARAKRAGMITGISGQDDGLAIPRDSAIEVVAMALRYVGQAKRPPAPRPVAETTYQRKRKLYLDFVESVRAGETDPMLPFTYDFKRPPPVELEAATGGKITDAMIKNAYEYFEMMGERTKPDARQVFNVLLRIQELDPPSEQYNRWMRAVEKRIRKLKLKVRP